MTNEQNYAELGSSAEVHQITTFIDDVNVDSYEKPMMSSTNAWTRMAEDSKLHDIHAILQRPVTVYNGEFNSSFTNVNLKFPDIILQKSVNVVKKLDYFTFFRANVKVRLVFNATPFMSGKYWMFFAPFDAISNRGARLANLSNCTGFPGIEVDMASNAPVEIKIPYCSPLSHYNLLDTHSNMGELYIVPLNDIQSGTSPLSVGATFTIFAWFEDIELALPTSRPVTVPPTLTWRAQVGRSEEQAMTSGPPISGMAKSVAGVASSVGGYFPMLSKLCRPVEWVSRAIGGAAESLGWNKPTNLDKNCLFSNVPAKGYTNADGIDLSSKLCAMPDNGLTYDGGIFSTDIDEMDIKYVASKSCTYRTSIPWTITTAVDSVIHYNTVNPGMATGGPEFSPTTCAFIASMFRYWRGTLKYRLTVAKTAFHTGRLRITYHPGIYGAAATTAGVINENAYNWILDLSVSSELEFEIPYVSNVPWKECNIGVYNSSDFNNEKYSTGTITVTVLTQLRRASDNVANNCPVNMWISGGDDIAFAIPDFGKYAIAQPLDAAPTASVRNDTTSYDDDVEDELEQEWVAQVFNLTSKGTEHNEQVSSGPSQSFPMQHMRHTAAEELTMGEKITNLRQLIKRFGITSQGCQYPYRSKTEPNRLVLPGPIPLNNDSYLFNEVTVDPAFFGVADGETVVETQLVSLPYTLADDGTVENEIEAVAANHYPTRCPLYYISYLYRFYRGGRRYKMANPVTNGLKCVSTGIRETVEPTADRTKYTTVQDGFVYENIRPNDPMIVNRAYDIKENGKLKPPEVTKFVSRDTAPLFEHYVYPDLNGTIEFEVPYYGQTPISLVGEGTILNDEGPLIRRSLVQIRRSEDPRGLDRPMYDYYNDKAFALAENEKFAGGIRNCFGAYTLYEAAADDFSFGYLIGAPRIKKA